MDIIERYNAAQRARERARLQESAEKALQELAEKLSPSGTGGEKPAAPKSAVVQPEAAGTAAPAGETAAAQASTEAEIPTETLEEVLAELDALVGLEDIKAHVRTLVNLLKIQAERKERGLPVVEIGLHRLFVGNPGTGKTTLARIMGRLYKAAGRLSKGHLIEVDRQGLVGGFVGQTAIKTREQLDKAAGGVLFLDEAYALVPEGSGNDFGQEAITTILKFMEDNRGDFAFIAAGYPKEMKRFLDSNSGFASRFNEIVDFPDYSSEELLAIFKGITDKNHYRLNKQAQAKVVTDFEWFTAHKGPNFANGRLVRKYFEEIVQRQANRLGTTTKELSVNQLKRVLLRDLPEELAELA